jgi:chromosome segregation ATPase
LERSQEEIDDQKEQVKHQLEHLRLDKERIAEERGVVQKAVDDKTSVQRAEVSAKEGERDAIRREIEELLAKLKAKQQEEARLTTEIDKIGRDISDVTAMYGAKLAKLDDRQARAGAQVPFCT